MPQNVSLYGQSPLMRPIQRDYANDPRRLIAQQLMQSGTSTAPVQSPLEGIARALQGGLGGYFQGQANREMQGRETAANEAMLRALGGAQQAPIQQPPEFVGPPAMSPGGTEGVMQALGAQDNPDLAPFAQQLAMGQMGREQEMSDLERRLQLQQQYATPKAPVPGRDIPFSPEVQEQKIGIAAAARPQFEAVPGQPGVQKNLLTGELTAAPLTPGQKTEAKVAALEPKAKAALQGLERQTNTVVRHIDKALDLVGPWTTGYGSFLSGLPDTEAGQLKNELDTIRANVGFDKLQSMRDASPTGGALGQVSEMENKLLQAVNGALDPKQSDQLVTNLNAIKELYPQVLNDRKAAYNADYGTPDQTTSGADFEAEYAAMPSGTVFTDPNGQQRTKP